MVSPSARQDSTDFQNNFKPPFLKLLSQKTISMLDGLISHTKMTTIVSDRPLFLSTLVASPGERKLAFAAVAVSLVIFLGLAPFAKVQLEAMGAFIPAYESSLVVLDLVTVAMLGGQYFTYQSKSLLILASGYLFTAMITVVHALTFPGLYAPSGLLGAGPQSTAWLYMFWHGVFPVFVISYARTANTSSVGVLTARQVMGRMLFSSLAVLAAVVGLTVLSTAGHSMLPSIMDGNQYTTEMKVVVTAVWLLNSFALIALWQRKSYTVLDLWLMVVMFAWMIDIALSAVLNQGRFDIGFYAGRIYGLLAASFVLVVLLVETGILYRKLIKLSESLRHLSLQDGLTGIANRRAFDNAFELEWRRAQRSQLPLSLIMIDVDHFKAFNDNYGHLAGDQCLKAVANVLQAEIARASDLLVRYGGEEFAVLLSQTDKGAANTVAERLRKAVVELEIRHSASSTGFVTVSVGVANCQPVWSDAPPAQDLLQLADESLYAAKSLGRNRVVSKELP